MAANKPDIRAVQAVVFDCDGVMFDSTAANVAFYNRILAEFGKASMTAQQFAFAHMATADQAMARLFPDPDELTRAQAFRKGLGYHPFIPQMIPEPGLTTLLGSLRPRFRTAVSTNRSDTMASVLEQFDLNKFFEVVVTSLDVARPKPHPDPLVKVLDAFGLAPEQAVYIGDAPVDSLAARAAGIPLIAYKNQDLDADWHVDSHAEIMKILEIK